MIALRGKIERNAGTFTWTGDWAFGESVVPTSENKLPFQYTFVGPKETNTKTEETTVEQNASANNKGQPKEAAQPNSSQRIGSEPATDASKSSELLKKEPLTTCPPPAAKQDPDKSTAETKAPPESSVAKQAAVEEDAMDIDVEATKTATAPGASTTKNTVTTSSEAGTPKVADSTTKAPPTQTIQPPTQPHSITVKGHPLPNSGSWKGRFDTLTGRKGQETKTPTDETFDLVWNLEYTPNTSIAFEGLSPKLSEQHLPVTGKGENQYGKFEVIGVLNLQSQVLEVQKRYLLATAESERIQTRKRQLSWKKRASLDEGTTSTVGGKRGRKSHHSKLLRITVPNEGTTAQRKLSHQCPMGPKKRASLSPRITGQMKLPHAGDPVSARWRAAHFLYYMQEQQRSDESHTDPKFVVYEGEMLDGFRDGRGVCLYNNGMIYEGEWRNDRESGHGVLMSADRKRIIYKGEWERGRMHGNGTYYYDTNPVNPQQQIRYEGEFRENLRHGTGTYVLPGGSVYSGQWRDGVMCGRATFTWKDGSVYDGEFKDGKRHGMGVLKTSDGFTYDGAWVYNSMEGRGSATYPNGQQYDGMFSRGRREGRGTIVFTNGAVYEGRFRDDMIDGQGTMKISRSVTIPRVDTSDKAEESASNEPSTTKLRDDFMIPVFFQSDLGHIHRKAGFTHGGT